MLELVDVDHSCVARVARVVCRDVARRGRDRARAFFARATDPRWADATALWARPDDDDAASLGIAVGTTGVDASSCRARVSFRALLDASLALAEAMTRDDHPGTFRRSGPPRSRASDGALLADATAAVLIDSSETLIVAYFACLFAGRAFAPVETALPPAARAGVLRTLTADAGLTHVLVPSAEDARAVARSRDGTPRGIAAVVVVIIRARRARGSRVPDPRRRARRPRHLPATPSIPPHLFAAAWTTARGPPSSPPGHVAVEARDSHGGTTGAPKAVLCDHRGSILSHAARAGVVPFTPDDITGVLVFGVWDAVCALLARVVGRVDARAGVLRQGADGRRRWADGGRGRHPRHAHAVLAALLVAQAEDEQTTTEREGETSAECRGASGSSRQLRDRALRNLRRRRCAASPSLPRSPRRSAEKYARAPPSRICTVSRRRTTWRWRRKTRRVADARAPYPHVQVRVADRPDFCVKESRARDFFQPREFASSSESPSCTSGYLYLGGPALALGYLGAGGASANASRFGVDANGARWYATGDCATLRADGRIRLLGRGGGATEAKVRGARVDLVAAEEALRAHPEVAECACVARRIVVEESNGREGSRRDDRPRGGGGVCRPANYAPRRRVGILRFRRGCARVDVREGAERGGALARGDAERLPLTAVAGSSAPKRDRRALETVVLPERRRGRDRRDPKENDDEEDERVARMTALAARVMRETLPSRDGDSDEDADPDLGFCGVRRRVARRAKDTRRASTRGRDVARAHARGSHGRADTPRRARRRRGAAAAAAKHRGAACGSARSRRNRRRRRLEVGVYPARRALDGGDVRRGVRLREGRPRGAR